MWERGVENDSEAFWPEQLESRSWQLLKGGRGRVGNQKCSFDHCKPGLPEAARWRVTQAAARAGPEVRRAAWAGNTHSGRGVSRI